MEKINILLVDNLDKGSTVTEYYRAFKNNTKCNLFTLYGESKNKLWSTKYTLVEKILFKIGFIPDKNNINNTLINYNLDENNISVVFIATPRIIKPKTLDYLKSKNIFLISFSNDNLFLKHYKSTYFLKSLKKYDLFITMNIDSYVNDYLKNNISLERILPIDKSYSNYYANDIYNSIDCSISNYNHDIIFIGSYERERFDDIMYVIENINVEIHIYGPYYGKSGWEQKENIHKNLIIHNKMLIEKEYVEGIKCSKICLGFLRTANSDSQTSRTFEIPAYGGFMLMENTEQQKSFYKEKEEADFFSNREDLKNKIDFYLKNRERIKTIKEKAREVSFKNDYSYDSKINLILNKISNKKKVHKL